MTHPHVAQYDGRSHPDVYNTTDLTSSLPYGLNSQPARQHRLLQHSHSLPSSPQKLRPHLPVPCTTSVYHSGSFTELPYNVHEKTTRSKVLPKEVRRLSYRQLISITNCIWGYVDSAVIGEVLFLELKPA